MSVLIGYPTGWTLAVAEDGVRGEAIVAALPTEIEPWRSTMPHIPQHMQR